jgi:hypothetical protein
VGIWKHITILILHKIICRLVAPLKFIYCPIQVSFLLFVASLLILPFRYSLFLFLKYLLASRDHIVAGITICCPVWSNIKHIRMPSPVFYNVVNLNMGFPCRDIQVYCWMLRCGNTLLLTLRLLDVTEITNLTPLSLLISCKLSFPIVGSKSLPCLLWHWNLLAKFSYVI